MLLVQFFPVFFPDIGNFPAEKGSLKTGSSAIFTKGAIGPLGKDGVTRKTRTRAEGSTKLPGAILDSHRLARVAKRRERGTWMCRAIPPSPPALVSAVQV